MTPPPHAAMRSRHARPAGPRRHRKASASLLNAVGDNVRYLRRARGLTQEGLGRTLGVSRSYVCNIERGSMNVTLATLEALAAALNARAWELLHPTVWRRLEEGRSALSQPC